MTKPVCCENRTFNRFRERDPISFLQRFGRFIDVCFILNWFREFKIKYLRYKRAIFRDKNTTRLLGS